MPFEIFDIEKDHGISCLKKAKIIVLETQSTYQCMIKNLYYMTAKLELEHYIQLPKEFLLTMNGLDYDAPIKCKIRSHEGNNIIVSFM